jgi:aldehyde dehydrogenase (NAD+)
MEDCVDTSAFQQIYNQQKEYFNRQATKSYEQRVEVLKDLKAQIQKYESRIIQAMQADMAKPETEAAGGEIWYVLAEIDYTLRYLKRWMKPKRKRTPLLHFRAASAIYPEPFGQVLIMAPWNYPFHLLFSPLVGALAAGNTAILKPSELAPRSAEVIEELVNDHFNPDLIRVVNGGVETAETLLSFPFDYIFFTGGTRVGKIVMKAAAEHLTPVTLELGGKSPAIVDASADLEVAASRIVWGKFFNAGQTCIAPDYVLVEKSIHAALLLRIKGKILDYYSENPQNSPDLARIINQDHFNRLVGLLDAGKVVHGGQTDADTLYIAPTILDPVTMDDAIMGEEIFGPILPVLTFENLEDALEMVQMHPNPLALYLFTRDRSVEKKVIAEVPFGGGCINDTFIQVFNEEIPFGGRGISGMGAYHGKFSFDTFSHFKSIIHRKNWPDIAMRYPPYTIKNKIMRKLFKLASWLV